jgi:hypothetical protein
MIKELRYWFSIEDLTLMETCLFRVLDKSRCDCLDDSDRQQALLLLDRVQGQMQEAKMDAGLNDEMQTEGHD